MVSIAVFDPAVVRMDTLLSRWSVAVNAASPTSSPATVVVTEIVPPIFVDSVRPASRLWVKPVAVLLATESCIALTLPVDCSLIAMFPK